MLENKIKGKTIYEIKSDNSFTVHSDYNGLYEEYIITDSNEVIICKTDNNNRLIPITKSKNIRQRRYKQHINRIASIKNKNNINEINNIKVLNAFYNNGTINLITDIEIPHIDCNQCTINTRSIYVEYFNILNLLRFDINTMNYIRYIDFNREIIDTILHNCTINIIQEFEKKGENKWNDYRLTYYNVNEDRYFNHVININLNDKSIKAFNDIINNNKHNKLIKSINNIVPEHQFDKLIDAIKYGSASDK